MNTEDALNYNNVFMWNTKPEHFRIEEAQDGLARVKQRTFPILQIFETVRTPLLHGDPIMFASVKVAKAFVKGICERASREKALRLTTKNRKWRRVV